MTQRCGHTEEEILTTLRQVGISEFRELQQLREENTKLKRFVADLSLDRHMLQEIVRNKLKVSSLARWAQIT